MTPKPTHQPDRTNAIKQLEERWVEKQAKKKILPPETATNPPATAESKKIDNTPVT